MLCGSTRSVALGTMQHGHIDPNLFRDVIIDWYNRICESANRLQRLDILLRRLSCHRFRPRGLAGVSPHLDMSHRRISIQQTRRLQSNTTWARRSRLIGDGLRFAISGNQRTRQITRSGVRSCTTQTTNKWLWWKGANVHFLTRRSRAYPPTCREMRELDEDYGGCRNNSDHRTQPNHIEVCAGVARTLASHRHLEGILEPLECVVSQYQAPLKLNTRAHKITFLYGSELKCRANRQIFMFWLTATGFLQEFGCLGRDRSAVPNARLTSAHCRAVNGSRADVGWDFIQTTPLLVELSQ